MSGLLKLVPDKIMVAFNLTLLTVNSKFAQTSIESIKI